MYVHDIHLVHLVYSFSAQGFLQRKSIYTMYIQHYFIMVRRMKAVITQIEMKCDEPLRIAFML